jgi:hypothetical protein
VPANPVAPLTGNCLCGKIGVTITPPEPHLDACHCAMCRRWGGSAFLSTRLVKDPVITGAEHITRFASSDWAERGFCSSCGSHIFYYLKPRDGYSFAAGLFDGTADYSLTEEIFIDAKPDSYSFAGDHERLTAEEVIAKFGLTDPPD